MRISASSVSLLSLVVCVGAASFRPLLASIGLEEPQRRQVSIGSVSSPPPQCASSCGPVNNEISLGCPVTACCTTTYETQYYNCLECVGTALDATNYAAAQNSLNLLYTTCVDAGFVLPRLALPGQTASGSNASASAQPVSTGSSTALSPASSSASGSGTHATGAAISDRRPVVLAQVMIGATVLLWLWAMIPS